MGNHFYFCAVDQDFGPFLRFCSNFPYGAKLCINRHEYLKRQLTKRGTSRSTTASCAAPIPNACRAGRRVDGGDGRRTVFTRVSVSRPRGVRERQREGLLALVVGVVEDGDLDRLAGLAGLERQRAGLRRVVRVGLGAAVAGRVVDGHLRRCPAAQGHGEGHHRVGCLLDTRVRHGHHHRARHRRRQRVRQRARPPLVQIAPLALQLPVAGSWMDTSSCPSGCTVMCQLWSLPDC